MGGLLVLAFLRPYLLGLLVVGIGLSMLVMRVRQLPYALVAILAVVLVMNNVQHVAEIPTNMNLDDVQNVHQGFAAGNSVYAAGTDVSTPLGALLFLPRGLIYYLLSPFPWNVTRARQLLAVPESLVWMYLLFLGIKGMWTGAKESFSRVAGPIFIAIIITTAYSLIEGNIGTALRHRAQTMLLFFVFSGAEWARRSARARQPALPAGNAALALDKHVGVG
jgi:hypothetical protein